ncbi:glycosyltransferase, partial [Rubrivirga sp.]|uniref:glycosyltransferase n=1 Tax=Rubrivirga sp. TaxID=1885344 RepID=UPI003C73A2D3
MTLVALEVAAWAAVGIYGLAVVVLTGLGLHAFTLAMTRVLLPRRPLDRVALEDGAPSVVVQLPVYDEPAALVARALDAALALEYPGPVEIQLLDDSPPAAQRANAILCAERQGSRRVRHLPRNDRAGFKAGALAFGLEASDADLAAVFDVDFRPPPDTLTRLISALEADPSLAFVQARWTHPDAPDTWLARAQAAVLDVHFADEQTGRDRAGLPILFNGTAGVWRRAAIEDAGGWSADTLAEDLDLT